jgi:predicted Fe-Mo cluster-binding NifX family protein
MNAAGRRLAVAEDRVDGSMAPRLGRALRFALFDVHDSELRGPFYRVRHDDPGDECCDHEELTSLLHDCQVVIVGAAGARMVERLRECGIDVVVTAEDKPSPQLAAAWLAGTLERTHHEC